MTILDIAGAIEEKAPLSLAESWDISGWQATPMPPASTECTGVMLCLDVTESTVDRAAAAGCNLIVSHHPILFKAVRALTGSTPAQRTIMRAIALGIDIYSSHTALDSAPDVGVSQHLARALGLSDIRPLQPSPTGLAGAGLGAIGRFDPPGLTPALLVGRAKEVYHAPRVRVTAGPRSAESITIVALCSGSGGDLLPQAVEAGAQAYISSDIRYHDFLDYGSSILIIDTSHFESEICTKSILCDIISQKFPNFAVVFDPLESSPVTIV